MTLTQSSPMPFPTSGGLHTPPLGAFAGDAVLARSADRTRPSASNEGGSAALALAG